MRIGAGCIGKDVLVQFVNSREDGKGWSINCFSYRLPGKIINYPKLCSQRRDLGSIIFIAKYFFQDAFFFLWFFNR